jgi:hypothetical protein
MGCIASKLSPVRALTFADWRSRVRKRAVQQNTISLRKKKVRPKVRCATALEKISVSIGAGGAVRNRSQHAEGRLATSVPISLRQVHTKQGHPQALSRASWSSISALVVIAVDLLKEGLGVECIGWAGDAGDDRKRNQGGQDGLHGISH